jgi:hypothetical protein
VADIFTWADTASYSLDAILGSLADKKNGRAEKFLQ